MSLSLLVGIILGCCSVLTHAQCSIPNLDWSDEGTLFTALNLQTSCDSDSITVSIYACNVEEAGYDPSTDLTINGIPPDGTSITTPCGMLMPSYDAVTKMWTATINGPFSNCNGVGSSSNDEYYTYKNAITTYQFSNTGNRTIIRRKSLTLPFSCKYKTSYSGSGFATFDVNQGSANGELVTGLGLFNPTVQLCKDSDCDDLVNNGDFVTVCDLLYLCVETDYLLDITIYRVTAKNGDGTVTADLVTNGCPVDTEPASTVVSNGNPKATLEFEAFQFPDPTDEIILEITYLLCDPNFETCYEPDCDDKRRRRSLPGPAVGEVYTTMVGPFKAV